MIWFFCVLLYFEQILSFSPRQRMNPACKPPRGDVCVEIRDCPYFIQMLDNTRIPRPRQVIRAIREHQCGFTGSTPKVCCSYVDNFPSTQPLTKGISPVTKNVTNNTSNTVVSTKMTISRKHMNQKMLPQYECGTFLPGYRIMSGIKTTVGEFPWMALIASNTAEDGLDFRCAATLINDRYVLTAAHCVTDVIISSVRLGEHNIMNTIDCNWNNVKCSDPVQDIDIEEVIVHPNYFRKNFANDIALIRLAVSVNFTDFIQPICLPIGDLVNFDMDGKFAIITGWGVTESGLRSSELLKTLVPIVPNEQCASIYERYANISADRQLCAGGYRGRDSCGGDSGGPLQHVVPVGLRTEFEAHNSNKNASTRYVQFGIVSYGPRLCGIEGQPGVYTKITYYIDWIMDNLRSSS